MSGASRLTALQRTAVRAFFALPESRGFVLAGGAALLAAELVDRSIHDIDLFYVDKPPALIQSARPDRVVRPAPQADRVVVYVAIFGTLAWARFAGKDVSS